MRLAGRITDWNDDKGFGFVTPNGGGDRAFVHIKAFQRGSRRPTVGDLISYLPEKDSQGRLQARDIRHAGQRIEQQRIPSRVPRAAIGYSALAAIAAAAAIKLVPVHVAAIYFMLSGVAYLMYWGDKSSAQSGTSRTPETTLQLVGLLGGWPGALVAQQQFRHKTIKQPFQAVFWVTVFINLLATGWLVASGKAEALITSFSG